MYRIQLTDLSVYNSVEDKNAKVWKTIFDDHYTNSEYIINPVLSWSLGEAGTLTFDAVANVTIGYSEFKEYISELSVQKLNQNGYFEELWFGRVVNISENDDRIKTVTCEGGLNYLKDLILGQVIFDSVDPNRFIRKITSETKGGSGDFISAFSEFYTEDNSDTTYEVDGQTKTIEISISSDFDTFYDLLQNGLITPFGGYLKVYRKMENNELVTTGVSITRITENNPVLRYIIPIYITYKNTYDYNDQYIEFGKNLLSFSKITNYDNYFTSIIPIGTIDSTQNNNESGSNSKGTYDYPPTGTIYVNPSSSSGKSVVAKAGAYVRTAENRSFIRWNTTSDNGSDGGFIFFKRVVEGTADYTKYVTNKQPIQFAEEDFWIEYGGKIDNEYITNGEVRMRQEKVKFFRTSPGDVTQPSYYSFREALTVLQNKYSGALPPYTLAFTIWSGNYKTNHNNPKYISGSSKVVGVGGSCILTSSTSFEFYDLTKYVTIAGAEAFDNKQGLRHRSGSGYLHSINGVYNNFGVIAKKVDFGNVKSPTDLLNRAIKYMINAERNSTEYSLTMLDLNYLDNNMTAIKLGQKVRLIGYYDDVSKQTALNRIDEEFPIQSIEWHFDNMAETSISLSYKKNYSYASRMLKTVTGSQKGGQ